MEVYVVFAMGYHGREIDALRVCATADMAMHALRDMYTKHIDTTLPAERLAARASLDHTNQL